MSNLNKIELLGLSPHTPPEGLGENCRFSSNDDYLRYLAEAVQNSTQYWMNVAGAIEWFEQPRSIGGPGNWFEGGHVDVVSTCLGKELDGPGVSYCDPGMSTACIVSPQELHNRTATIFRMVEKWGLAPEDRVFIASSNAGVILPAILACLSQGLTCVPVNPRYATERLVHRGLRTHTKGAIVDVDSVDSALVTQMSEHGKTLAIDGSFRWENAGEVKWHPLAAMHPAFVLADSSGQLFTLPLAGFLVHSVEAFRFLLAGECRTNTVWVMSEPHHASTLSVIFGGLVGSFDVGILSMKFADSRKEMLSAIEIVKAKTILTNVKSLIPLVKELGQMGPDENAAQTLTELMVVEGEALEPHVWDLLKNKMFGRKTHVVQVLARPEGGGFVAGPHPAVTPVRSGSVAFAAPGMDIVILDSRGRECQPSHGGLMALRNVTPGLALEIQNMAPPITLEVKARKDRNGQIWPMGEMAVEISAAHQVSLAELEATIAGVEGVDQVAVVRLHEDDGAVTSKAFVKPATQDSNVVDRIKERVIERFGIDALPAGIQIVSGLPVGRSGKLLRSVLRRISSGDPISHEDASLVTDPSLMAELTGESSE